MLNSLDPGKRLVVYLVINIIVSALTTLIVMSLWTSLTLSGAPNAAGNQPTAVAGAGQLTINAVIGAGDLENERVQIEHVGDEDVSLAGWRLRDENGNEYRFPALVLHPDAQVNVFSSQGDDSVSALYWDRQVTVWAPGELVSLLDPSGQVQATYTVP